jgi:hypothetical protein
LANSAYKENIKYFEKEKERLKYYLQPGVEVIR